MTTLPSFVPSAALQASTPVDLSIIIAHRGPAMGLWMTVESCMMDLADTGLTYEFRVCANGMDKLTEDDERVKHFLEKSGHAGEFLHVAQAMSPPGARQLVAENANGKSLFFFDNHCMVYPGYFKRAVTSMHEYGIEYLHSSTRFFTGEGTDYSYRLSLKRDFWTEKPYKAPQDEENPYRIATAGHGGFVVRTAAWREIRGYFEGFAGYGGEETYTDLKAWLLGKEVWIDPKLIHLHWAGKRSYDRHFTDDYYKNSFMSAFLIGGERWLHTVFKSMSQSTRFVDKTKPVTTLFDLMVQAQMQSREHAQWISSKRVRTLDELLEKFKTESIPY